MKKCCLNCAFCVRYQKKTVNKGLTFYNQNTESILSPQERKYAFTDNFEFIGKDIKNQKIWENEYYQKLDNLKKGTYNDIFSGPDILDLLTVEQCHGGHFSLSRKFGMPPRPEAPDADYLACWHKLWNFENNEKEYPSLKNRCKCLFFFPYDKKGNKSFEGCEKERKALLNKWHFTITNTLVVVGIIVSIILYLLK